MRDQGAVLAAAVDLVYRHKLSVIPVSLDTKIPACKWKHLQERLPVFDEIASWRECNIGIVTGALSGVVVVDCESPEDAKWFHEKHGGSDVMTQTRRGYHFYFAYPGQLVQNCIRAFDRYDVRGDGGYVLAPPSTHSNGAYEWLKARVFDRSKLQPFKMEWRPEQNRMDSPKDRKEISDEMAYFWGIKAVAGQRGHDSTYKAAVVLRAAGLTEVEALAEMLEWNKTNASPPWGLKELLHKIQDAYR